MTSALGYVTGLVALAFAALGGSPIAAHACAFHDPIADFHVDHKATIPVAVAVRRAAENGLLEADTTAGEAGSTSALLRTHDDVSILDGKARSSPDAAVLAEAPRFYMLLIQPRIWVKFDPEEGFLSSCAQVDLDAIHDREVTSPPVVVTDAPVLATLATAGLSADRALAEGLMVIDAPADRDAMAIRRLLAASAPG